MGLPAMQEESSFLEVQKPVRLSFVTEGGHVYFSGGVEQGLTRTKGRVLLPHESYNFSVVRERSAHCF